MFSTATLSAALSVWLASNNTNFRFDLVLIHFFQTLLPVCIAYLPPSVLLFASLIVSLYLIAKLSTFTTNPSKRRPIHLNFWQLAGAVIDLVNRR